MKPVVSTPPVARQISGELRQRVLDLRRAHSLRQVAELASLPLGTVKTICSRSGAFRDNLQHRTLFTLPPIKVGASTAIAVPELPPQQVVTGDTEIDAVLWLHQVIKTGQASLIEKAMKAAARIKTPLKDVEKRYVTYLAKAYPGNFGAMFSSFGFADLEGMAKSAIVKMARQQEARARFDDVLDDTPAERFCIDTLRGMKLKKGEFFLDEKQVDSRFAKHQELLPHTLADCLHELTYWGELYHLRNALDGYGEGPQEAAARDWFTFRCLTRIRPRSTEEAVAVFRYLSTSDRMEMAEGEAILLNLLGARTGTETR